MDELNRITKAIIGAGINVHKELGPGLLESAYEACLAYELAQAGLEFKRQVPLPVVYKGVRVDCGYRLDLVVEGKVIVELKSVDAVLPIHKAQLLSYLKLMECKVGLLMNFNSELLTNGVERMVNNF